MYCERGTFSVKRAANGGYILCARDPAIEKKNAARSLKERASSTPMEPYIDPEREYAFKDWEATSAFITKNIDKLCPASTFESAFEALSDED